MSEIRKQFRFPSDTIDKLDQLVEFEKSKNKHGIEQKTTQTEVVIAAINLAHSSAFGKDVFDQTLSKLENVMRNVFESILREYAKPFGNAMDQIYETDKLTKEIVLLMLRANKILPQNGNEMKGILLENEKIEELLLHAIRFKDEI